MIGLSLPGFVPNESLFDQEANSASFEKKKKKKNLACSLLAPKAVSQSFGTGSGKQRETGETLGI